MVSMASSLPVLSVSGVGGVCCFGLVVRARLCLTWFVELCIQYSPSIDLLEVLLRPQGIERRRRRMLRPAQHQNRTTSKTTRQPPRLTPPPYLRTPVRFSHGLARQSSPTSNRQPSKRQKARPGSNRTQQQPRSSQLQHPAQHLSSCLSYRTA